MAEGNVDPNAGKKKKRGEKDPPPRDLRVEWENENIEIEGRKPTLEEIEEDSGDY
ncbi:MAG TPA: hypothetical protein VEF06_00640 [Bryobacteraceae bacterium]|nr:hypothetical protein [Bryobacteraceae bacterium]